jgi:putative transposase
MIICEYKLRLSHAQAAAMDEAIRTTQFIRNKRVRRWMDRRGVSANDVQLLRSRLAHAFACAARLTSQARQAATVILQRGLALAWTEGR